ncbi:hypothetical protein K8W45_001418 [Escherichia coli]|nr:hypothetical protein [Escherichia coli]
MTLEEKKALLRAALQSYSKEDLIKKFNSYTVCGPSIISFSNDITEKFTTLHAEVKSTMNDEEIIFSTYDYEYNEAA